MTNKTPKFSLHFIKIKVDVLVSVQNIRCLTKQVIEKLSENESCSLVLLSGGPDLLLHLHILSVELLVLSLTLLKLFFDFIKFVLQEVYEFVVVLFGAVWLLGCVAGAITHAEGTLGLLMATGHSDGGSPVVAPLCVGAHSLRELLVVILFALFKLFHLLFQFLDDFLAEM